MPTLTRRDFVRETCAGALSWGLLSESRQMARADDPPRTVLAMGFSLYGCPKMSLADAVDLVDRVGFDSVELPLMANWPGDPLNFPAEARGKFRDDLATRNLTCPALMEHLPLAAPEAQWEEQANRLKRAAAVARDLAPRAVPLAETVVGGKPGEWEHWRPVFEKRLRDWARLADGEGLTIAVKPHVGSALDKPEYCRDLIAAVDSPRIRLAFDFSHFVHRGFDLVETARLLAPLSVFVHLKDRAAGEKAVRFVLPGEGTIDTALLLKSLVAEGYRGPVLVEVSAQVSSQPGFSAQTAVESSYRHLVAAWEAANLARPS